MNWKQILNDLEDHGTLRDFEKYQHLAGEYPSCALGEAMGFGPDIYDRDTMEPSIVGEISEKFYRSIRNHPYKADLMDGPAMDFFNALTRCSIAKRINDSDYNYAFEFEQARKAYNQIHELVAKVKRD